MMKLSRLSARYSPELFLLVSSAVCHPVITPPPLKRPQVLPTLSYSVTDSVSLGQSGATMMKLGALVLLLAVAADQLSVSQSVMVTGSGEVDHPLCPMNFCGTLHTYMDASFNNSVFSMCSGLNPDCLTVTDPHGDRMSAEVLYEDTNPGSVIHQALPNITSTSHCRIRLELKDVTNETIMVIVMYNFGEQSVMQFEPTSLFSETNLVLASVQRNVTIAYRSFPLADWKDGVILYVSTCPYPGWTKVGQ